MAQMVRNDKPFVLVGSVRDDGPLPDVYTDVIEGQRAMRGELGGVGYAIMVATMLHAIATGNLLPAKIPLVCVDINPATVTKLSDRGSAQATGVVTDIGLFMEQLAQELVARLLRHLTGAARSGGFEVHDHRAVVGGALVARSACGRRPPAAGDRPARRRSAWSAARAGKVGASSAAPASCSPSASTRAAGSVGRSLRSPAMTSGASDHRVVA